MKKPFADLAGEAGRDSLVIDAMPTKELFIEMLTRDIALIRRLAGLQFDNSALTAKKWKGEGSLKGFPTRLTITPTIVQNRRQLGGGITVETAREVRASFRPPAGRLLRQASVGCARGRDEAGDFQDQSTSGELTTVNSNFVVDVDAAWAREGSGNSSLQIWM